MIGAEHPDSWLAPWSAGRGRLSSAWLAGAPLFGQAHSSRGCRGRWCRGARARAVAARCQGASAAWGARGGDPTARPDVPSFGDMACPGAACSEVFSGPALAKVLRPAVELQQKALEALEKGEAWEPLSIHTSAGEVAWVSMRIDIR